MNELNVARDLIMRKLIFTTAKCQKPFEDRSRGESDVSYLRHEFAVLVNTGSAEINGQFTRAFEIAERLLNEGANFRVTVCPLFFI